MSCRNFLLDTLARIRIIECAGRVGVKGSVTSIQEYVHNVILQFSIVVSSRFPLYPGSFLHGHNSTFIHSVNKKQLPPMMASRARVVVGRKSSGSRYQPYNTGWCICFLSVHILCLFHLLVTNFSDFQKKLQYLNINPQWYHDCFEQRWWMFRCYRFEFDSGARDLFSIIRINFESIGTAFRNHFAFLRQVTRDQLIT